MIFILKQISMQLHYWGEEIRGFDREMFLCYHRHHCDCPPRWQRTCLH